ncbi:hypothetical protein HB371_18800 [Acinetobacter baumannii]|uniref:hypothetical protein n=1 Tax=Acinetobacter baumannii TaxID=470 RepID=UPI001459BF3E|nr:hypothetical protein [Acinetobacter baumannii]NLZ24015.1 hypothetical protein [Acinetobacter baumannii]
MNKLIVGFVIIVVTAIFVTQYFKARSYKVEVEDKGYYILNDMYEQVKNSKAGDKLETKIQIALEDGFVSQAEFTDITNTEAPSMMIHASEKEYKEAKLKILKEFKKVS